MRIFTQIHQQIIDFIWIKNINELPKWRQNLVHTLRIGHLVFRDLLEGQLTLRAMGLVYTTLLSLVPFIAISFSVLKGFGVHNQIEPMLLNFLAPLGDQGVEITRRVIEFVNNMRAGVLGTLGLALLLYTVISLMQKIERSFNYMWHVSQGRAFVRRFSDYLSVILIGPVLVFTALGITASIASLSLVQHLMEMQIIGTLFETFSRLIPYLLVIIAFVLVYMLIPNTKVHLSSAIVGGVVAGISWETAGWIFASFVVNSAKYTAIYSVFASLIIFMIWLYVSWLILLMGCGIAFYYQHPEQRHLHSKEINLSNRMKEELAIAIMAVIAKQYYGKEQPSTIDQLSNQLSVGVLALEIIIQSLINSKILITNGDEKPGFVPAYAPEVMSLKDIISAIRKSGETELLNPVVLMGVEYLREIIQQREENIQDFVKDITLKDLVELEAGYENNKTQQEPIDRMKSA